MQLVGGTRTDSDWLFSPIPRLVSQCTRSAQYPFIRWLLASLTRPPGRPDERRSHDVGTILTPSLSLRPRRTRADGRGPTRRPLGRQRRPASAGSGDGPGIGGDGRDGAVAPSSFRPPPPSPRPLGPSPPSSWALGSPSPPLGSPPPSPRPLGASPPRGPSSPLVGERAYRLGRMRQTASSAPSRCGAPPLRASRDAGGIQPSRSTTGSHASGETIPIR
jgi:hypothetical protein